LEKIDANGYEVTPYGRRPKRRGLKLKATILIVGAAVMAVWILV
jgi:hypothetical protein